MHARADMGWLKHVLLNRHKRYTECIHSKHAKYETESINAEMYSRESGYWFT